MDDRLRRFFFFQAEDGIRDVAVTGVQTCALPILVLASAALAACVQGEQQSRSADSTARNLTLAPTESTAALKDVPAPATEAAKPAPEMKAPVKKPVAAKPAPLMLAAGTPLPAPAHHTISTRPAKA